MRVPSKAQRFTEVALEHRNELFAAALRFVRNRRDAEDLVQDTFLRAFAAWETFEEGSNCRAWLYRILTNSFINDYRRHVKERRWLSHGETFISQSRKRAAADPEGALMEPLLGDEVVRALSDLPEDFRRVVMLADLYGMSYREIAKDLRCPMGTVMSRLFRARRLLEAMLKDYAAEQGILRPAAQAA